MKFEWDDDKDNENKRKHGISFEEARADDDVYRIISARKLGLKQVRK